MADAAESARTAKGHFPKGQTGNPKGRPRKDQSAANDVRNAFAAKVPITEGGKRKTRTKQQLGAMQLANQSASGDLKATKLGFDLIQKADALEAAKPSAAPQYLPEADKAVVERLVARLRLIDKEAANVVDDA